MTFISIYRNILSVHLVCSPIHTYTPTIWCEQPSHQTMYESHVAHLPVSNLTANRFAMSQENLLPTPTSTSFRYGIHTTRFGSWGPLPTENIIIGNVANANMLNTTTLPLSLIFMTWHASWHEWPTTRLNRVPFAFVGQFTPPRLRKVGKDPFRLVKSR